MDDKRPNSSKAAKFAYMYMMFVIIAILLINHYDGKSTTNISNTKQTPAKTNFTMIVSSENQDLDSVLQSFAKEKDVDLKIEYAGTLDIMERLNAGEKFDSVWASNSIWLYMLENVRTSNSKSTSINPVVFAIKKSKAESLGFTGKDIYTEDIVEAIKAGKLKFSMSNPTQTNTGATAYLGLLSTLAGNPEVLKKEDLQNENLKEDLVALFSGLERSSGSESFLEEMFLNGSYDAVVTYEFSIININKELVSRGEEPLYVLYPIDGVSISDSPLAYIDNKDEAKKEFFTELQEYILSDEGQAELAKRGRRTWYGGINKDADKTIFNPAWGINTEKYIVPVKYPSTAIIKESLGMYQTELRKPVYTVFCLDYSGSMYPDGYKQLTDAMNYILDEEKASANLLQYSEKDKITVIPFNSGNIDEWTTTSGVKTKELRDNILKLEPGGATNIYDCSIRALQILSKEDTNTYNLSVVLMTDGMSNTGSYASLSRKYKEIGKDIPIYSIMFGDAYESDLRKIADLSNAKVFDGKLDLLKAFKEVRGYN